MNKPITGTVVDGRLSLDEAIDLPNHTRVELTITSITNGDHDRPAATAEFLEFIKSNPIDSGGIRFTRDELHERD